MFIHTFAPVVLTSFIPLPCLLNWLSLSLCRWYAHEYCQTAAATLRWWKKKVEQPWPPTVLLQCNTRRLLMASLAFSVCFSLASRLHLRVLIGPHEISMAPPHSMSSSPSSPCASALRRKSARDTARRRRSPFTLEKLVGNEKGEKERKATEVLIWLLRSLSFTCFALQKSQANASEELAGRSGVRQVLRRHPECFLHFRVSISNC